MKSGLPILAAWPLASLSGAASGTALGWLILRLYLAPLDSLGAANLLAILILMPMLGFGLGSAQALVLRRYGVSAGWWVLATVCGWLLGFSVDFTLQRIFSSTPWMGLLAAGLYLGALQWLVLRRASRRALLWIPTSLAGWGITSALITLMNPILEQFTRSTWEGAASTILTWGLAGLAFGLLSAPALSWIFPRRG